MFPELDAQFQQPAPTKPAAAPEKRDIKVIPGQENKQKSPTAAAQQKEEIDKKDTGDEDERNLVVEFRNMGGALPYARNLAYCYGEAVLTNKTHHVLTSLVLKLTYGSSDVDLKFKKVNPQTQQAQRVVLVGSDCEYILNMPQVDIPECKLSTQSTDACKKKVRVIPPRE